MKNTDVYYGIDNITVLTPGGRQDENINDPRMVQFVLWVCH